MTGGRSYGSPGAFRLALTDKLRDLATRSRWTLQQLQRQMAYDRLLERLYLVDEGWIIKGATALLARGIGVRGLSTLTSTARWPGRLPGRTSARRPPWTLAKPFSQPAVFTSPKAGAVSPPSSLPNWAYQSCRMGGVILLPDLGA
jgi:hypothetical protein